MATQRSIYSSTSESIKIAVYCSEDLVFGIGRMYESLVDNDKYDVMIFRNEKDARKWLGI